MSRAGAPGGRRAGFGTGLRDLFLRMLPHRAPTGLRAVGRPGRDAPVLVTGNYALTVRRVVRALRGRDAWLLCADSRGINVWCAAGGGHLTHHDIIAAVRVADLARRVDHRDLVLPQLCATGVERRRVAEVTGFHVRWGPARLEDLPAYLDRGRRVVRGERRMRFPPSERLEMAVAWGWPLLASAAGLTALLRGWALAASVGAALTASVAGLYLAVPRLRLSGAARWAAFAVLAALGYGVGVVASLLLGAAGAGSRLWLAVAEAVALGALAVDFEGTTPWYASALAAGGRARVELVEDRCSGAAECVQVCPRDVLAMDGRRRKVRIARPDACIRCGACIVQCPEQALRFRMPDGGVVEAETVRRTRLDLLGRRSVTVDEGRPSGG